jgi:antirestriction protein ArdC
MPYASDKAKKAAEEALDRLSAELEAGKSEALKNYLGAMGRFRRYSWNNVLLISSQRPDAMRVAGFHTWHDLGRSVKKGEKGIMIFAPVVVKREASPDQAQVQEPGAKEAARVTGFRTAYVFDVSQTEGKPLPEFAKTTGDPKDYTDKLKALAAQRGIAVEYDPSIAPAVGMSSGGRIRLIPDLPKGEEFAVLVHELAHEMLHQGKDAQPLPKVARETQAEAVAYVVSRGIGLETNRAAADYIALYNGDKATLAKSLSAIQETSAKILDELLPEERPAPSQAEVITRQTASPTPTQFHGQPSQPPEPDAHQHPATEAPEAVNWNR